ncbi:hypothetical protein B0H16DRAFT_1294468, partial [Mycena metata]
THFHDSSLKSLGLRVQLGHRPGEKCASPLQLHPDFVVLHSNGIHEVAVNGCDCKDRFIAGPPEIQLMHAGWFPATDVKPLISRVLEHAEIASFYQFNART